jgi:hypothetical protein
MNIVHDSEPRALTADPERHSPPVVPGYHLNEVTLQGLKFNGKH